MFLDSKSITVTLADGTEKAYTISKFPAVAGREIVSKYPIANMPKLGDYAVSEEIMLKLMCYVGVEGNTGIMPLNSKALVDNHVPEWETLAKLEAAMMDYNCSFFQNGKASTFLGTLATKAEELISSILTDSLGQLSQAEKPRSTNSKRSTRSKTPS